MNGRLQGVNAWVGIERRRDHKSAALFSATHGIFGEARVLRTPSCYHKMTVCFFFHKVQQMASFLLPSSMIPPHLMKGHGSQVILLVSGSELALFTIHGVQLAAFQDHQRPITSMWVVSVGLPVLHPHLKSPWPHLTWLFISRTRAESSPLPLTYPCESMCGIKKRSLPSSRAAITCLGAPTDGPGNCFHFPSQWPHPACQRHL